MLGVVLSLTAAALCLWIWVEQYLRIDFNELGRHYDADALVVHVDSSFVWGLLAFGFLLVAAILIAYRGKEASS